MSRKAKKLLITTVSHEIFIVRLNQQTTIRGFCPSCATEIELLGFDSAVSISGISGHEIARLITADGIHSIETATGHLLICKRSLARGQEHAIHQ